MQIHILIKNLRNMNAKAMKKKKIAATQNEYEFIALENYYQQTVYSLS